ncbi:MAG: LysR family transcriptional regulator [Pseudomonadales bacterium]|nr:LysR family transcriptional regulator [Pseudomonadales bacterium]
MFAHFPQLNSLRAFDAAARLTSFKAAALELNVTPTAVSHQIRNLEEKLGTLLFERKPRAITLTPEGEKLALVTYHSFQQISAVLEEISDNQKVLTLSTTSAFAAQWLVPKLDHFHSRHSDIHVVVKTGEDLDDVQKDMRIDLAIRYGKFNTDIKNATMLVTERFGMYATKEYLQDCPRIEKATLLETTWKNKNLRPVTWEQYFQHKGSDKRKLKIRFYDQEHHVIQAALAGQGIALVSSLLVQASLQQGWLTKHPSGETLQGMTYYMISKSPQEESRKVGLFREWLLGELIKDA